MAVKLDAEQRHEGMMTPVTRLSARSSHTAGKCSGSRTKNVFGTARILSQEARGRNKTGPDSGARFCGLMQLACHTEGTHRFAGIIENGATKSNA